MIIAITGSFGSGKSTVSKILKKFSGYEIVDADVLAKHVFNKNKARIKKEFGTSNRKKISEIVFNNKKELRKLNSLIHPEVIKEIKNNCKKRKNLILDIPLLIETNLHKQTDVIILIKSPKRETIKRLSKRYTKKEIEIRIKNQLPEKEKIKHADFVINNKSEKELKKKVGAVWKKIMKK